MIGFIRKIKIEENQEIELIKQFKKKSIKDLYQFKNMIKVIVLNKKII